MTPLEFYIRVRFGKKPMGKFASEIGLDQSTVSQIVTQKREPWPLFKKKSSMILQVPEHVLFTSDTALAKLLNGSISMDEFVASWDKSIAS